MYEELELNINRYTLLKEQTKNCYNTKAFDLDFTEAESQTDFIMNITIEKYKQLIPSIRVKRGLLNPLGALIKTITGNLDNDDAVMYEKLIREVSTKQNALTMKVSIISEMLGSFIKIANSTKSNFIQIDESILNINRNSNESKLFQISHKIIHIYNMFLHNFQTLYIRLNEVETAIAFANIKMLHGSFIDTDELLSLFKEIESTEKLVFPASVENIVKLEQSLEIKAYMKQNQIKLIIRIPLITNEIYNYFKLIPLPILDKSHGLTSLILPKFPYVLVRGLKAMPLSHSCREIDEDRFLCSERDTSPIIRDDCTSALMTFATNTSSCHPVPVIIDDVKVFLVQSNRWIVFARMETLLTQYCDNEVTHDTIQGTYLLTIDDNCCIKINDFYLKKHESQGKEVTFTSVPIVNLPKIASSSSDSQRKPVNLNGIDLGDIQSLNYLLQKNRHEDISDYENYRSESVSIGSSVLFIIIIICLVFLAFKNKIKKLYNLTKVRENLSQDNLELAEGGVIPPTSTSGVVFNIT